MLRRYLELTITSSGAQACRIDPDEARGSSAGRGAQRLWVCTVGIKLDRDPHRLPRPAWIRELESLLRGRRRSMIRQMPERDREHLERTLEGDAYSISPAWIWALADAELSAAMNAAEGVNRINLRTGGSIERTAREVVAVAQGWQEAVQYLHDSGVCTRSMGWLDETFERCGEDDPSFLSWMRRVY